MCFDASKVFKLQIDFNRYNLGKHGVCPIPKMSNEQVESTNKTRKFPEGYWLMTKETNFYNKKGNLKDTTLPLSPSYLEYKKPIITVIKGEKNYPAKDLPTYYDTLPAGYMLENTCLGTYLKKSDVKSALFNFYQTPIYVLIGICIGFCIDKILKHIKK